ncbi:hypothetical protein TNIN_425061 [Trichonephila inaurata madagascariensis]|uniref:Uncharacterized protein n=1 Tax=Trichonephila inaurata madagascariensis TaxID=2747483 RepID=A0A8X6XFV7_9ARAC|nr:hypothetical protein TNIN_425061 [Trichonephila inaurata madagascariensis]
MGNRTAVLLSDTQLKEFSKPSIVNKVEPRVQKLRTQKPKHSYIKENTNIGKEITSRSATFTNKPDISAQSEKSETLIEQITEKGDIFSVTFSWGKWKRTLSIEDRSTRKTKI